ncbi:MAG: hypothetical protein KIT10_08965 [Flavobacteriales bacterium]|nr:hypothetical protein [Flavobacteriales bacterium]
MKKSILLSSVAVLCTLHLQAQIPNGGFENWTPAKGYEDPTGWFTSNLLSGLMGVATVEKGSPAPAGSYHIKLTSKDVFGEPFGAFAILGFPYTQRPQAFNGRVQYMSNANDPVSAGVLLTRWNASAGEPDIIGVAETEWNGSNMAWQQFSLPFQYESLVDPDSAYIILLSSGGGTATLNNYGGFDDLAFGNVVGIEENADVALSMYPSPATDVLFITAEAPIASVELWSADGRLVHTQRAAATRMDVSVHGLAAGRYVARALLQDGTRVHGHFVKE